MSIERRQIYFVNLNPVQGREQSGEKPVLDKRRFPSEPAGYISDVKMLEVEAAVRYCLGL